MIHYKDIVFTTSDDALFIEASVTYEYDIGRYSGPAEDCYPEEFEIVSSTIDSVSYIGHEVNDDAVKEFFLSIYNDEINELIMETTYEHRS